MEKGKFMLIGASLLLVVGVMIGVITGVNQHKSANADEKAVLATTTKPVASVCSETDYKRTCVASLSTVANNGSATPKDFLETAIKVAIEEVQAAMQKSATIGKAANDSLNKMAVEDCKDLLQYAIDELQASFSSLGDSTLHTMNDREIELKNWLSAVISYQEACIDGFTQPDLKSAISDELLNSTQLTGNALAIVAGLSQILSAFNIPVNLTAASRRLLEADHQDNDNYPSWFSATDRHLLANPGGSPLPPPNAVVAKDGSGQYKTITEALAAYPKNGRYVIYVKEGIYDEYITVDKNQVNVFMYGDGPRKTIVTGHKSNAGGFSTFQTASFSAIGTGFICRGWDSRTRQGPEGGQAVALRVQADMAVFYNCRMDGHQDTLYVQAHRQFYRNCVISGTVDFIFGDSATVIQNCLIIARRPQDGQANAVTAQGRTQRQETTGIVIQNCRIVPEQKLEPVRFQIPTYLGRPWKQYSRTVIMESTLGDFIQPAGWLAWQGNFALDTLYYAEYANCGPGANTTHRVNWKGRHVIKDRNEALQFTIAPFIQGDQWLRSTAVPFFLGLRGRTKC